MARVKAIISRDNYTDSPIAYWNGSASIKQKDSLTERTAWFIKKGISDEDFDLIDWQLARDFCSALNVDLD